MSGSLNTGSKGETNLIGLLQIVFIVLKLLKVIDWKWIWVLSPMWLSVCVGLVLIAATLFISAKR